MIGLRMLRDVRAGLLRELRQRAVVIEAHHRREIALVQPGRIALSDQRIRVRRIADDQHAHVAVCNCIERLALH